MIERLLSCFAILIGLLSAVAWADPVEVGGSLLLVSGAHVEQTGAKASATLIPAPLLVVRQRWNHVEIELESIPPLGPQRIGANGLGLRSTALSYFDGTLRHDVSPGTQLGVGEIVYNQQSIYQSTTGPFPLNGGGTFSSTTTNTDRSRIVGAMFGAEHVFARGVRSRFIASVAFSPSLHGVLGGQEHYVSNDANYTGPWSAVSETGSQIAAIAQADVHANRRVTVHYGVRYLNMVMRFTGGQLADRNGFIVPFAGLTTALGR